MFILVRSVRSVSRRARLPRSLRIAGGLGLGFVLMGAVAMAQTGVMTQITGKVVNSETGAPLPYTNLALARVAASGDTVAIGGVLSRNDGSYRIEIAPGNYRLVASYIGYHGLTVTDIIAVEGTPSTVNLALKPQALAIEAIEVTAKAQEDLDIFQLQRQKKAGAVSDGISAEQIRKTNDSNAAEALQRVTGLSVVGGQYVYVRGLGERYSATTVNGSQVGTPEANKRVLPMDLFASSLLDHMVVQKTYTPDQPGEFGGGVVDIATREFPGEKVWNVTLGTGYNSATTGRTFHTYSGGDVDFLGFDDGTRQLPSEIPARLVVPDNEFCEGEDCLTPEETAELGRAFNLDWRTESRSGSVPRSFSASYGNEAEVLGRSLSYLGSMTYAHGLQTQEREERTFDGGDELSPKTDYDVNDSESSVLWGGIGTLAYRMTDFHQLDLNVMYNRSSEDGYRFYEGQNFDYGSRIRQTQLSYVERGIFTASSKMKHNLPAVLNSVFHWKLAYSNATRNEPDRRSYVYEFIPGDPESETVDRWELSTRGVSNGFVRTFGDLHEDARTADADWSLPFRQWGSLEGKLQTGLHLGTKDRQFGFRRFAYVTPSGNTVDRTLPVEELLTAENVGTDPRSTFRLREFTRPEDSYRASHDVSAQFVMVDMPLTAKLRIVTGIRRERSDQSVTTFDRFQRGEEAQKARLVNTDYLPAVNLTYALGKHTNLRAAFSRTLNRPDLRELSPFSFNDQGASAYETSGNPDLVRARIQNYDLRAEFYPSLGELVAVSGFYKAMTDPIEQSIQGGQQPTIRPVNADEGSLYGIELEARLAMARLASALHHFGANFNLTFVESETEIDDLGNIGSAKRPLTGQSPYVVNGGIFFGSDGGTAGSLLYTVFGKRLHSLGLAVLPDIYERPRHSLDAAASHRFGTVRVKLGVENLLNAKEEFRQADQVVKLAEHGRSVSLSFSTGS